MLNPTHVTKWLKRNKENEVERSLKAEIRKEPSLAVGEARKAVFQLPPGWKNGSLIVLYSQQLEGREGGNFVFSVSPLRGPLQEAIQASVVMEKKSKKSHLDPEI